MCENLLQGVIKLSTTDMKKLYKLISSLGIRADFNTMENLVTLNLGFLTYDELISFFREVERLISKSDDFIEIRTMKAKSVSYEYMMLAKMFGKMGRDWQLIEQALLIAENSAYDRFIIKLANGTIKAVYFDISSFFKV